MTFDDLKEIIEVSIGTDYNLGWYRVTSVSGNTVTARLKNTNDKYNWSTVAHIYVKGRKK